MNEVRGEAQIGGIALMEQPRGLQIEVVQPHLLPDVQDVREWKGSAIVELLEDFRINGFISEVMPFEVGAMTDSPIFTHRLVRGEEGEILVPGDVFWYPHYQVSDPAMRLLSNGEVFFQRDPEGKDLHQNLLALVREMRDRTGREYQLEYRLRGFPVRIVLGDQVVKEFKDQIERDVYGQPVEATLDAERRLQDWMDGVVTGIEMEV